MSNDLITSKAGLTVRQQGEAPILRVTNVGKAFGPTQAVRDCSLDLFPGEVHALVGENGSGKSTLVKILAGVHRPDRGAVWVGEGALDGRVSPRFAQELGIATVFQEVLVVESQTVFENVWLGADGLFVRRVATEQKRKAAQEALSRLLARPPKLDAPVDSLSLSDRQACCLARALVRRPRVLILDEATSTLDVETRERLFEAVRELCNEGSSVIFISHRMDEITELADRITVLRSGTTVITLDSQEASTEVLVQHMTGADHLTSGAEKAPREATDGAPAVLRAEGLRLRPGGPAIDFTLTRGELVGVAGLEGHGQDLFLHALRGAGAVSGEVYASTDETRVAVRSPQEGFDAGIVYVPRDRRSESSFPNLSILENFGLPTLTSDQSRGRIAWKRVGARLASFVADLGIKLDRVTDPITVLSGGNQQKVILARWLAANPSVILMNDPTRGIDLGAKRDFYRFLERVTAEGRSVVMLSTEVDEHVELMDRVLVFREGGIVATLRRAELNRSALVAAFFERGDDNAA
jgi:ABC-type sugar transport system ATPase subunit